MLEAYFLEFDLNTHKLDHMFETAIDQLDVTAMELSVLENTGMYSDTEALDDMFYEAAGKFVEMVKTFFQKIREYIKKLYNSVKDAIQSAIRKYECKKKLKELKDQLDKANEFAKSVGGKSVEIIDTKAIYKAYSEFMDTTLKEVHRLYSKTYDDEFDYEDAVERCIDAIEDKADDLDISEMEAFTISAKVGEALSFTVKEQENIDKIIAMITDQWTEGIDEFEKIAMSQDDAAKVAGIKRVTAEMNKNSSQALNKIKSAWQKNYKTIIGVTGGILAAGAAVGIGAGAAVAHKNGNKLGAELDNIESMGSKD